ncbi:MAG: DsbA family protein [Caulobacteraceae bacterium]
MRRLGPTRIGGALAAAVLLAAGLMGAVSPRALARPESGDMTLGRARAPVTVIEYASAGCPHCAAWATNVFPEFEKRYISTGRVRFVLREEITGSAPLATAGFLTARCAGPGKYFQVLDEIFAAQPKIFQAGNAYDPLLAIAKGAGLSESAFMACLKDNAAFQALLARSNRHVKDDGIESTPTFVIGDQKLVGDQTLAELGEAIARARRR